MTGSEHGVCPDLVSTRPVANETLIITTLLLARWCSTDTMRYVYAHSVLHALGILSVDHHSRCVVSVSGFGQSIQRILMFR